MVDSAEQEREFKEGGGTERQGVYLSGYTFVVLHQMGKHDRAQIGHKHTRCHIYTRGGATDVHNQSDSTTYKQFAPAGYDRERYKSEDIDVRIAQREEMQVAENKNLQEEDE